MKRATFKGVCFLLLALLLSWSAPLLFGGGWEGVRLVLACQAVLGALVAFIAALLWFEEGGQL